MEYIFEDFVAGFIEQKFSNQWKVEYQKSNEYLSNKPKAFNLQHDIFLTSKNAEKRKVIIDTKYKLRSSDFKNDIKKGVTQSDLYQMVSYAFKRGCTDIYLLYPNLTDELHEPDTFEIISGFNKNDKITVTAMEIPFWTEKKLNNNDLEKELFLTLSGQFDKLVKKCPNG